MGAIHHDDGDDVQLMVFDEECACWLHDYNYKGSYTIALAPGEEFKAEYRSAIETAAREGAPR